MKKIVLTGFRPFGIHSVNDSETCVEIIKNTDIEKQLNVKLVTEILDVNYTSALERVKSLWAEHNPFLVVHLGVHREDSIVIEKCARKIGYTQPDVKGARLSTESCPFGSDEVVATQLDLSNIQKFARENYVVQCSDNAGLYLCEYVYYISLSHDSSRTVFIHVPPFREDVSSEKKALIIKDLIQDFFRKLLEEETNDLKLVS